MMPPSRLDCPLSLETAQMGNPGEDCKYGKSRLMNRAQEDLKLKSMMAIKQFVQRLDPNVEVCFDSSQWFYREVLGVILAIGDREAHPVETTMEELLERPHYLIDSLQNKLRCQIASLYYWVHQDYPTKTARVHEGSCTDCNCGKGKYEVGESPNRKWCSYPNKQEAFRHMESLGWADVGGCGNCNP